MDPFFYPPTQAYGVGLRTDRPAPVRRTSYLRKAGEAEVSLRHRQETPRMRGDE